MKCAQIAVIAGLAAGIASAAPETLVPVTNVAKVSPSAINGIPVCPSSGTPEALTQVYDNRAGLFFSSGAQPNWGGDDGLFTKAVYPPDPDLGNDGPDANGGFAVTEIDIGFVQLVTTQNLSVDVALEFWNDLDPNGTVAPVNMNSLTPGFALVLAFTGLNNPFTGGVMWTSDDIDITPAFPAGITFPDANWGVTYRFRQPGTTNLFAPGTFTLGFSQNSPNGLVPPANVQGPVVGGSGDVYWRDADGNNQLDLTDARFFGGAPNWANFYLGLTADITVGTSPACCVDFNGDTEVDFTDVEGFLAALNGMIPGTCAPGADFNGDTEFDFSDIESFIGVFNMALGTTCTP